MFHKHLTFYAWFVKSKRSAPLMFNKDVNLVLCTLIYFIAFICVVKPMLNNSEHKCVNYGGEVYRQHKRKQ